jgi:hypothetical protein
MEKNKKEDAAFIQKLIREEQDAAFYILTKKGLLSRLEERLQREAGKKAAISNWIRRPWPAIVSLLLVVLVFMLALLFIFSPSQKKKGFEALETYLQTTPGFQTLTEMVERSDRSQTVVRTPTFWLTENIENMLGSIYKEEGPEKKNTTLLKHKGDLHTFNLEEKIRILLIEKKIHRFLNEFLEKKEEDKNDTKNMSSDFSYTFLFEPLWS